MSRFDTVTHFMRTNPLKIISLNIETDRHFDRFIPFIKMKKPDIILLQEVLKKDMPYLEKAIGMRGRFVMLAYLHREKDQPGIGLATFTNLPIANQYQAYYFGDSQKIPIKYGKLDKIARAILVTKLIKKSQHYCVINTHFTWTPDGKPSEQQHKDLDHLLTLLSNIPEFVLCGDFNAPRGTVIFDTLALKYKDNIPKEISTTIDKNLHSAGDLNLVVDGIFTTPEYCVDSIKVIDNLSDHCAILAKVNKKAKVMKCQA